MAENLEEKTEIENDNSESESGGLQKIEAGYIILIGLGTLAVDIGAALFDVTFIGMIFMPPLQFLVSAATSFVFKSHGDKNALKTSKLITKAVASVLPLIPTTLGIFLVQVLMHNHPKLMKTIGSVAGKIGGAYGKAIQAATKVFASSQGKGSDKKMIGDTTNIKSKKPSVLHSNLKGTSKDFKEEDTKKAA